jgi:CRP/FNR family transcriptional regulator
LGSIYPIKTGFLKAYAVTERGDEQVMGFYMSGEIMGLDAVETQIHTCTATALEDSEVCIVPFCHFENLCMKDQVLQRHFHRVMASEISNEHRMMVLLGSRNAEERVVSFLLNLSARLLARGYSSFDFNLRMSREEIGSYLGLKLETISRVLSHLHEQGAIDVDGRHLRILDLPALQRLLGTTESTGDPTNLPSNHS